MEMGSSLTSLFLAAKVKSWLASSMLRRAADADAAELAPGAYWLLASHRKDFTERDNVVAATLVWVSRLAIVTVTDHPRPQARHTGYVVDTASERSQEAAELAGQGSTLVHEMSTAVDAISQSSRDVGQNSMW